MKHTIKKSDKNLKILDDLIGNGFYSGHVGDEKFELTPNRFLNNYRLIGLLNESGHYDLKLDYKWPMNISYKILLGGGILVALISLINGNWVWPVILLVLGLMLFVHFKIKEKKEINLLTQRILEFSKSEL